MHTRMAVELFMDDDNQAAAEAHLGLAKGLVLDWYGPTDGLDVLRELWKADFRGVEEDIPKEWLN